MARGRMISKSLSTSQKFAALPLLAGRLGEFCQVLYPLLVAHADDFGRLQGDPFTVKHLVFPTSPRKEADFQVGLSALHRVGLIEWYESAGTKYLQIQRFEDHQQGLHKRTESKLPAPSGVFPEIPPKEKGTELKGREENRTEPPAAFERFWSAYPKKKAKDDAKKAWDKRKPSDVLLAAMLRALERQQHSPDWQREEGRYIPNPATWLNRGQWQDEPVAVNGTTAWVCPHDPPCTDGATQCSLRQRLGRVNL